MRGSPTPADEELLMQVSWIRGLAQAILRDYSLAEDVSQEVLLRALTGEPRHGRVLRAWLAAVTRNTARSVLRERKRRNERERLTARPEAAPPPRDPAEALEAHQALVRAIGSLPVEARQVVLLRYYEDLGFPEIAQRLGVSENAARVRLHRALAQLRTALGRDGSDWHALCLLALPAGTIVGPGIGISFQQFAVMKGFKIAILGVIVLLLLLAYSQFDPPVDRAPDLAADSPAVPIEQASSASEAAARLDSPLHREELMTSDPAASWVMRGRASRPGGAAAAHARVRAVLRDGYDAECPVLAETILDCDAEGRFRWGIEPPRAAVHLSLQPEGVRGYGDPRLVLAGEPPPQDLSVTVFHYGLPVTGIVRNQALEPIAGATVLGGAVPVTTDEHGAFLLQGMLEVDSIYLYAHAEGYAQEQRNLAILSDVESRADFVLVPEFVIRGRVRDEADAPVAGAVVAAFQNQYTVATTDDDGNYELKHLSPRTAKHHIFVRKAGYCEAVAQVPVENRAAAEQDLVLRRGALVAGRVIGADGRPLEGAQLYIGFSPDAYNQLNATAHEHGEFRIPNVHPGEQTLVAQYPGMPESRLVLLIPEGTPEVTGVQLMMERGHFVAGRVIDEQGESLGGAYLELQRGGHSTGQRVWCDENGDFRLEELSAAGDSFMVFHPGFLNQEVEVGQLDRDDLVITMQRCGRVAGRVIDGATGLPLSSFIIRFDWSQQTLPGDKRINSFASGWLEDGVRFEDADGQWSCADELEVGSVLAIEASAPGYGRARAERVVVERDPSPDALVLRLMPGAVLRGRVLTADGAPLARAEVSVLTAEQASGEKHIERRDLNTVFTDQDGRFQLVDLEPVEVHLLVVHADWRNALDGPIQLQSGDANAELILRMDAGRALRGVVREVDGAAIADAIVMVFGRTGPNLGHRMHETKADADGRFEVAHLTPGIYQVLAARPRGTRSEPYLSIRCSLPEDRDREVLLQPVGSATIRGRVILDGPMPELGSPMRVQLSTPGYETNDPEAIVLLYRSTAVLDGSFSFESVAPAAYYTIEVQSWSLDQKYSLSAHQGVSVGDGEVLEVELKLELKAL
jgi:RNA polymerase sigma factor (sigma-70 family)